jgi:heme/copper-type cytochrome/quinol oxidase subunit 2
MYQHRAASYLGGSLVTFGILLVALVFSVLYFKNLEAVPVRTPLQETSKQLCIAIMSLVSVAMALPIILFILGIVVAVSVGRSSMEGSWR